MNQMELSFNARIENEPFARTSVASFITSLNPTIDELVEIKTIISEGLVMPLSMVIKIILNVR